MRHLIADMLCGITAAQMSFQKEGSPTLQAIRVMRDQSAGGHIFNMDGAGADGGATPRFAAYGATKRSLAQLSKSLQVLQHACLSTCVASRCLCSHAHAPVNLL